jgi:preprotein translocase subunit SecA
LVLLNIINKIIGDQNEKELKRLSKEISKINTNYEIYLGKNLSNEQIKAKTQEFKDRLKNGETLDQILPEAFALAKYAAKTLNGHKYNVRGQEVTWNMIPFDVQLIGGLVIHEGKIAEMKTGEGKTLTCSLPAYLNALSGDGVFIVTVNDYLARRDAEWMQPLYETLGLSVGVIVPNQDQAEKIAAYKADITYGTNNEFGFDYLRDNMAIDESQLVQPKILNFAIVDEVDSILIDEARTPLIISAPAEESTEKYLKYANLTNKLVENEHYNIDEKQKTAVLTEAGINKMEELMGIDNIYSEAGFEEVHHIEQALKAKASYKNDRDYVVENGEVVIVDDFTGRLMAGRRYSGGLHQAIEAKEGVEIKRESKTLATITFQNFFRLFNKLAGMTGTAKTEEEEFYKIYGLGIVAIPTNKPVNRVDKPDLIFRNQLGKYKAIAKKVKELHEQGMPVLIGTVSVEQSETLSEIFKRSGIRHNVLNAKQHEKEAEIVADAGQEKAVTIATNMAGRGTDIKIKENVKELGGLTIIGTERHESRRIDNQLRGRSGRQGDPGETQFYISMEDDLMRIFGGDRVKSMMDLLNLPEDEPIENKFITKAIESAQKRVEGHNFDIRKHVVEYDDIMNYHREIVYKLRKSILLEGNAGNQILVAMEKTAENIILTHQTPEAYNYKEILETLNTIHLNANHSLEIENLKKLNKADELIDLAKNYLWNSYKEITDQIDKEQLNNIEKQVFLRSIDRNFIDHIDRMDSIRKSVALEAYGQKNPLLVYKDEAYRAFTELLGQINTEVTYSIFRLTNQDHLKSTTIQQTLIA